MQANATKEFNSRHNRNHMLQISFGKVWSYANRDMEVIETILPAQHTCFLDEFIKMVGWACGLAKIIEATKSGRSPAGLRSLETVGKVEAGIFT